jgi:hypothetical protein
VRGAPNLDRLIKRKCKQGSLAVADCIDAGRNQRQTGPLRTRLPVNRLPTLNLDGESRKDQLAIEKNADGGIDADSGCLLCEVNSLSSLASHKTLLK